MNYFTVHLNYLSLSTNFKIFLYLSSNFLEYNLELLFYISAIFTPLLHLVSRNFRLNSPKCWPWGRDTVCVYICRLGELPTPPSLPPLPLYPWWIVPEFALIIQSAPLQFPRIFPLLHFSSASLSRFPLRLHFHCLPFSLLLFVCLALRNFH